MWEQRLQQYDALVERCERFKRLGKTMPYTSANGYMFSLLNKNAELGIRFSKAVQEKYMQELPATHFVSHGAVMKGYILVPDHLWEQPETLIRMLNESYNYVCTLEPK